MISGGDPVGLPGIAVMAGGLLAFLLAVLAARARREPGLAETGAQRSPRSMLGIAVQGVGIAIPGFGGPHVTLDPLGGAALVGAAVVAVLMGAAILLFIAASRAMGRNWSLVARTRSDHHLVTTGPFALMRHPIYTALFLVMVANAIAFGHTAHLIVAVPLYALGTWLRVVEEERLLRAMFGSAYTQYAARVRRFFPGVF